MRFLLFRRPELLIAIATGWLLAMATTAAAQGLASDSSATERLYKALAEPTEIVCKATPFGEIINQLKLQHKIEIHIDPSITAVGITATTPVTREIRGVSLGSALDLLLHDMNLDYAVKDEVILIASREAAARLVETRLYDVGDLVTNSRDGAGLSCGRCPCPSSQWGNSGTSAVTARPFDAGGFTESNEQPFAGPGGCDG